MTFYNFLKIKGPTCKHVSSARNIPSDNKLSSHRVKSSTMAASRWADTEDDKAVAAQRKLDKEQKKLIKAEKALRGEQEHARLAEKDDETRPTKRRRLSAEQETVDKNKASPAATSPAAAPRKLLRHQAPGWYPSRHVDNFERLNHIEEGSYGWVSRAKETATGEVVALKKLKMDGSDASGFPVTGLREIQCLMACRHRHVVDLREVVVGNGLEE